MKSYKSLTILSVSLTILLSYNFMSAAWSNPTATAPASNTDAPINVGSTAQTKAGTLGVDALLVEGAATVASPAPRIKFDDTDAGAIDFWTYLDSNMWSLRTDRNGDGTADAPHPVRVYAATSSSGDYVAFSNQVRAAEYCDENGNNCAVGSGSGNYLTTASTSQTKTGTLSLYGLLVEGATTIASPSPNINFLDTDPGVLGGRLVYTNNVLQWQVDRNNDGVWDDDSQPMKLVSGATSSEDYAKFANETWTNGYCDSNGKKCFNALDVIDLLSQPDVEIPNIAGAKTTNANKKTVSSAEVFQLQNDSSCTTRAGSASGYANDELVTCQTGSYLAGVSKGGDILCCPFYPVESTKRMCRVKIETRTIIAEYSGWGPNNENATVYKNIEGSVTQSAVFGIFLEEDYGQIENVPNEAFDYGTDLVGRRGGSGGFGDKENDLSDQEQVTMGYWSPAEYSANSSVINSVISNAVSRDHRAYKGNLLLKEGEKLTLTNTGSSLQDESEMLAEGWEDLIATVLDCSS